MAHQFTNALINESSPYLLQHAHNPVNWNGWNDEAWKKAKAEDKLVIVSVGYSACHWCHVMEHESFEDETVARIMNDHFVSIKVDREERPDVDQIYMDACQMVTGRGGWPLNAITLPDGRPIYAGTYYPKENWKQLLLYFVDYWQKNKEEAFERATDITNGIRAMDVIQRKTEGDFAAKDREAILQKICATWDFEKGGRSGAPKFPMPVNLRYLLRNYYYTKNQQALKAAVVTLDNMMNGGIYDQVGGGFARYSVDADWEIPHFEKMLYDNAQLVSLYSEAYRLLKNDQYKTVVYETLEFVERELTNEEGAFYSALDADSEGHEGKFYVWTVEELKEILGKDFDAFSKVYNVSAEGNFEGTNNLTRKEWDGEPDENVAKWRNLLLNARSKRIRPGLDDKTLTSWNALMLLGYSDAYKAFGEERFLKAALRNAQFIKDKMLKPDLSLMRTYKNGKASIPAFLDDYSFTIEAFISVYQVTFEESWLKLADELAQYVIQHFYNASSGLFFYTSINDSPLIARKTETSDNVIPSSNSSMMKNLFTLGLLLEKEDYLAIAKKAVATLREHITGYPTFYAQWAALVDWIIDEPYEVAFCGKDALSLNREFSQWFSPKSLVLGTTVKSSLPLLQYKPVDEASLIYVCKDKSCGLPVATVVEAFNQMNV
ncbi:MAG: thioredoxin domain-containing protein [Chitinophagales bacterium]